MGRRKNDLELSREGLQLLILKCQVQESRINKTMDSYLRSTGFTNKPSLMGTKTSSRSAMTSVGVRSD